MRFLFALAAALCFVNAAAAANLPDTEATEPTVVFRWYDEKGLAHDTTDASTIPPGVKRTVLDKHFHKTDIQKRRQWWQARKSRLEAELHAAEDARRGAEYRLAQAVKNGRPNVEREPYRQTIARWKAEEARLKKALDELREEAKRKRVPEKWLK